MIWKSLLISFILNNDRLFWKLLNYNKNEKSKDAKLLSVLESIPDNITNNNKTFFKREYSNAKVPFTFSKKEKQPYYDGYDHRFGINKTETISVVMNITKFLTQMKLLNDLENVNISKETKVELIETYNRNESPPKYSPNIKSGGLFQDWD
jgi:hypothetical protein